MNLRKEILVEKQTRVGQVLAKQAKFKTSKMKGQESWLPEAVQFTNRE